MKVKGITYDIGTEYLPGVLSRNNLREDLIEFDMDAIKNRLNCNAVRIYGKDEKALMVSSEIALKSGLNVWLSPRLINGNIESTLSYLKSIAAEFEQLRLNYTQRDLVLIIGGELTIDMNGFLEGNTINDRTAILSKPLFFIKNALGIKQKFQKSFTQFLHNAVSLVKNEFAGKITYASAMWEKVDWTDFDIISMNLYKASFNKSFFNQILKKLLSKGKPVAITEFGCCCYLGADEKGPTGYFVLDSSQSPPVFREKCIRDEAVQANYIFNLLQIYDKNKIEAVFVFDFFSQWFTFSENPENDYDRAGFGITKSLGNNKWEPKESFHKIAEYYEEN